MTKVKQLTKQKVEEMLKDMISQEFIYKKSDTVLTNNLPLLEQGIVDSVEIIRLISFIEETFDFTLDENDLFPENFETINAIRSLVIAKCTNEELIRPISERPTETMLQKIEKQKVVRQKLKSLADVSLVQSEPSAWYETLYIQANGDSTEIPWARNTINPHLQDWLNVSKQQGEGKSALVIGCGLGDDAEALSQLGFNVTAFDVSSTAIAWCHQRFPNSNVNYLVADLLNLDSAWQDRFDLVVDCYCIHALPLNVRSQVIEIVSSLLKKAGIILVIAWHRDDDIEPDGPPWAMSDKELAKFQLLGLEEIHRQTFTEEDDIFVNKILLEYSK